MKLAGGERGAVASCSHSSETATAAEIKLLAHKILDAKMERRAVGAATVLHSVAQCCTELHRAAQCRIELSQCCTVLPQCCTVLHRPATMLHTAAQCCPDLPQCCTVLLSRTNCANCDNFQPYHSATNNHLLAAGGPAVRLHFEEGTGAGGPGGRSGGNLLQPRGAVLSPGELHWACKCYSSALKKEAGRGYEVSVPGVTCT